MKIAIITEGFSGTGYGHLTRCLSIYEAFEEKNIIPLYIANCDENVKKFAGDINLLQLDWLNNSNILNEILKEYDIAIIDSYLAQICIYENIQKPVRKAVYIDDYIRLDYPPGIIVNGSIGAENLPYKKDNKHQYLLGINYMPLRKEFWDVKIPARINNEVKNVLITFGGQDIRELSFPILNILLEMFPDVNYHIIKEIDKRNHNSLKNYSSNIFFYTTLNAQQMCELMVKCDIAITAAGQTTYELARIGLPTIAIGVAENQRHNIMGWIDKGFLTKEIWYDHVDLFEQIIQSFKEILNYNKNNATVYCNGQGARCLVNTITG